MLTWPRGAQTSLRGSTTPKAFSGFNIKLHKQYQGKQSPDVCTPRQSSRLYPYFEPASVASGHGGVKVFQTDQQQNKRIFAEVRVHASVDQVWRVITDYDHLAEFVPNLVSSKRIASSKPGAIHLRQVGCSQSVFWRLEAEAVLECVEVQRIMGAKELRFIAIEGDFKEYRGSWVVEPDPVAQTRTLLKYEISLQPQMSIPSAIVTCVVKAGLPANIMAMAKRAEKVAEMKRKFPRFAASALAEEVPSLPWSSAAVGQQQELEQLPEAGPTRPIWDHTHPSNQRQQSARSGFLGMASVIIPRVPTLAAAPSQEQIVSSPSTEASQAAAAEITLLTSPSPASSMHIWTAPASDALSDAGPVPAKVWGRSPELGVGWRCVSDASAVTEVHLRRLENNPDMLHRRVVAVLTVEATPEEVWEVLTDYERLPEVVPNLAVCERVGTPSGMSSRVTRLRQVGYKHMLYMSMHAEAVVDLVEKEHQEVQFRQVQGDFSLLQGKFMLQKCSEKQLLNGYWVTKPQTHLKYAVEVQIARDPLRLLGMVEPIIERMVYEDLPLNLGAIKSRVEEKKQRAKLQDLEEQGEMRRAAKLRRRLESPPADILQTEFAALQAELERFYGDQQKMPTRPELRAANRGHLERAIAAHGGFGAVAAQLGWEMAYNPKHPRGYWSSIMNVKAELDDFIEANGLQPGLVPSLREVRKAARCDLARAIEKWGGPSEVAEELAYSVVSRSGRPSKASSQKGTAESILGSMDSDSDEPATSTMRISAADTLTHQAQPSRASVHAEQQHIHSDRSPSNPSQVPPTVKGKAPTTANKRLISSKRKTPRLLGLRQEIDEW